MAYIAQFDPEWHDADPYKDRPFSCDGCGMSGTWEDCLISRLPHEHPEHDVHVGVTCPWCGVLWWEEL